MIEINLLPQELKVKELAAIVKKKEINPQAQQVLLLVPMVLVFLVCVHLFLFLVKSAKEKRIRVLRGKIEALAPKKKELEKSTSLYTSLSQEAALLKQLTVERINWPQKLSLLSARLPSGIWFTGLSVSPRDFLLEGSVISLQQDELTQINIFIDSLKNDEVFFNNFDRLTLSSVQKQTLGSYEVSEFTLSGKLRASE